MKHFMLLLLAFLWINPPLEIIVTASSVELKETPENVVVAYMSLNLLEM